MSTYLLPLTNVPQKFAISLAGKDYIVACRWNDAPEGGWVINLIDEETNVTIASNIPLITGADCLEGLQYLEIGGGLIVYTDGDEEAVPTLDNLGVESNLYFVTEDDA